MKKYLLSSATIVAFLAYGVYQRSLSPNAVPPIPISSPNDLLVAPTSSPLVEPSPHASSTTASTPKPTPTVAPSPKSSGLYKDGTYTGGVADAFYGNLQVQAVIRDGKLADVTFLQYPNDREHSREINAYALPILRQEAISAQKAKVDVVSGATASSEAFVQSLGSALSQAL